MPLQVLVVNAATGEVDNTTLATRARGDKWADLAYAPNTQKLYGAPYSARSVLTVDPVANTTDETAFGTLPVGGSKWCVHLPSLALTRALRAPRHRTLCAQCSIVLSSNLWLVPDLRFGF